MTFKEAARENTGKSMCDSGDHYGRHYEKAPIDDSEPIVTFDGKWNCATIETSLFLEQWSGGVDDELQAQWEKWDDENGSELDYFESATTFCEEVLGLTRHARDNTYNSENDLSQNYVWEVWGNEDTSDWIYPDENTVSVFFIHTGCDIRGGYSKPVFVRPEDSGDEYSVPMNLVAGWYPIEAHDPEGNKVEDIWSTPDVDSVSIGYCSNPSYNLFENYAKRVFAFLSTKNTVCILTEDGYKIKLGLEVRLDY